MSTCGAVDIIGGYMSAGKGAVLEKVFKQMPDHFKVKVVVTVFFVDSWDSEWFVINANKTPVKKI